MLAQITIRRENKSNSHKNFKYDTINKIKKILIRLIQQHKKTSTMNGVSHTFYPKASGQLQWEERKDEKEKNLKTNKSFDYDTTNIIKKISTRRV